MKRNRIHAINDGFLEFKPIVERHASFVFRRFPATEKDEAIAEAIAVAFKSFVRLVRRGKNPIQFPTVLAQRAAHHVLDGRRIGSRCHNRDVFALAKKSRHDCRLRSLPNERDPEWPDALIDNRHTPIPEQVSFRCDFPRRLATLSPRDRAIANLLAVGHRAKSLAGRFGLSEARISQLRAELYADWTSFHGECFTVAG
jgi:hypothetical protein